MDTQTLLLIAAAVIVVLVVIGLVVLVRRRRRRRQRVEAARTRYGAEFDRTRAAVGSDSGAADALEERERRHDELDLTDLGPADQDAVRANLAILQHRFVDDPGEVLARLSTVATQVLQARGYPIGADREEGLNQLALDHPESAQRLRRLLTGDYRDDTAQHREVFLGARTALEELAGVRAELRDALAVNDDDAGTARAAEAGSTTTTG